MTFHKLVSLACTIITTTLFCFIERVVEPYCTVEVSITILSGLLAPSIILVHLLSPLLPAFKSCRFDAKKETKPRSKMATKVDTNWETKIKMLETKFESKCETKLYLPPFINDIKDETKFENKFEPMLDPVMKIKARNKGEYKDPPPHRRYQMIRALPRCKDSELRNLIDLTQYQDSLPPPPTLTIVDNDVFYDTPNSFPA